jgi:fructose/tagatose bisphosphate aldolase
MDELYALVRALAEPANVPVLLHQDHPGEDRNIIRSLRRGAKIGLFLVTKSLPCER